MSGDTGPERRQTEDGYQGPERRQPETPNGLPVWLTITVVLTLLALLAYNVVIVGPEGLPTSYILGGLLGAYAGIDQLLRRGGGGHRGDKTEGG